jgi:hypothetical protein
MLRFSGQNRSCLSAFPHRRIGVQYFQLAAQPVDVRMSNWVPFTVALLVFAGADIPGAESLHPSSAATPSFAKGEVVRLFPIETSVDDQSGQAGSQAAQNKAALREESKLELIRFVSGEFAKAVRPLPGGKEGFLVYVGKPVAWAVLDRAVATHGAAINTGDHVQITKLEFRDKAIVVDVNGGGRPKRHWRDHIQFGMGGSIPTAQTTTTTPEQENGPPGIQPGMGSTLFLEFEKSIPDMTPDELKQILTPFLNFAKERSASLQWIDTLPPEMKKAIQDRRPLVGMDREEIVAAIGRPEHKVRERDSDGNDIEDWIYGQPPSKTIFVRFLGDRVTSIEQFPK